MSGGAKEVLPGVAVSLVVIVAAGAVMGLHQFTIVEWWQPALVCGVLSVPVAVWLSRYIKRYTRDFMHFIEYPVAFILSICVMLGLFYTINFCFSDQSSGYVYNAPVVRKYMCERTRTRRVGRHSHHTEKYSVGIVEIRMKDGWLKELEKPVGAYNRIKEGGTLKIYVEEGFFKIPVIKSNKEGVSK